MPERLSLARQDGGPCPLRPLRADPIPCYCEHFCACTPDALSSAPSHLTLCCDSGPRLLLISMFSICGLWYPFLPSSSIVADACCGADADRCLTYAERCMLALLAGVGD